MIGKKEQERGLSESERILNFNPPNLFISNNIQGRNYQASTTINY